MYFFIRTNNPRPMFHFDMTADERSTMHKHVEYWPACCLNDENSLGKVQSVRADSSAVDLSLTPSTIQ
jgi:hypothetical protein